MSVMYANVLELVDLFPLPCLGYFVTETSLNLDVGAVHITVLCL